MGLSSRRNQGRTGYTERHAKIQIHLTEPQGIIKKEGLRRDLPVGTDSMLPHFQVKINLSVTKGQGHLSNIQK